MSRQFAYFVASCVCNASCNDARKYQRNGISINSRHPGNQIPYIFHHAMFMSFSEDARNKVCSVFRPSQNLAGFVIYDIRGSSHIKVQLHLRLLSGRALNAQPYGWLSHFVD